MQFKNRFVLCLVSFTAPCAALADTLSRVLVIVEQAESAEGAICAALIPESAKDTFPKVAQATAQECAPLEKKASANSFQARITFDNIAAGTYAVAAFHDLNSDGVLNTKSILGFEIPAEPFGFSKNPTLPMRAPTFQECSFEVNKSTVGVGILLKNLAL
jgi:uncharacterized protein (DUF2141 family)